MKDKDIEQFKTQHRAEVLDALRQSSVLNDPEEAVSALEHAVKALANLSRYMAGIDFQSENPCEICGRKGITVEAAGKTTAYMAKVVNEGWRLLDFARGKADSRLEVTGVKELMQALTPEQFDQVDKWYQEGLKRAAESEPDTVH